MTTLKVGSKNECIFSLPQASIDNINGFLYLDMDLSFLISIDATNCENNCEVYNYIINHKLDLISDINSLFSLFNNKPSCIEKAYIKIENNIEYRVYANWLTDNSRNIRLIVKGSEDQEIVCNMTDLLNKWLDFTSKAQIAIQQYFAVQAMNKFMNVRITNTIKLVNATKGVDLIFKDLSEYLTANPDSSVIQFFGQLNNEYKGLDNSSLKEEIDKAKLIIGENGKEWNSVFSNAEQNYYLWGQIRCLLNWSSDALEKFKSYESKFTELLDSLKENNENTGKFYAAIITESDYWKEKKRMYIFTADRDYSIKRYLRDEDLLKTNGFYASSLKTFIDNWLLPDNTEKTAIEYLNAIIQKRLSNEIGWKKCILRDNSILDYSYWKTIFITDNDHILLGKNKTQDSHCIDPCLLFIKNQLESKNVKVTLNDSQAEPPNSLEFSISKNEYEIKWGKGPGAFEIKENEKVNNYSSDEEMLNYISSVIKQISVAE